MLENINTEKIIIKCPKCGQKLKIPKTTSILRVTCPNPNCGLSFRYPKQNKNKQIIIWFHNKVKQHPIFLGLIITFWFLSIVNRYLIRTLTLKNGLLLTAFFIALWFFGAWIIDKLKDKGTKWYYKKWFVIIMLFLFTPIGIALLWSGSNFKKSTKIVFTIVFGLWFVVTALTRRPGGLYYSPKDEISKLLSTHKENIFLETVSRYNKTNLINDILQNQSSATKTLTIPQIVKKYGESIVLIRSLDKKGNELGQGSGFVISSEGAIVTNYHVVEFAYNVSLEFINGKSYQEISLIACYPDMDIVILYIEDEEELFSPVILGNSDDLQIGERILAIGNPYGWENTLSDGLISGIREIDSFNLLQITAPISPGSSGGALLNMKGEAIGITTIASLWGAQNLNFAIPINTLKYLIKEDL